MKPKDRFMQAWLAQWDIRASLSREQLRERGKLCASCDAELPQPNAPGFRQCARCRPVDAHAVYMVFRYLDASGVWRCRFLDDGHDEKLLREVTFARAEKVRETAKRGKGMTSAAGKLRVNYALGRCSSARLWLQLSGEQYLKLQRHSDNAVGFE